MSSPKSNPQRALSSPKQTISIETYISNPNQITKLNSPRTLEAIKLLGYTQEDIMYIPINKYSIIDQSFRTLSPEMQKKRYQMYNEFRLNKIQEIYELRNQIDLSKLQSNSDNNTCQKSATQRTNVFSNDNVTSTAIIEEKKQFEKMKRKNEMDLMNMIEYELQRKVMTKEAEAKIRKQQMKIESYKREKEAQHELEIAKKNEREKKLLMKQLQEEEEQRQRDREKYLKEQQRLKEEMKKEKERLRENKRKHEEQERKRMEFEEKINKMNEEKQNRLYEKMEYLNLKEEKRQKAMEEQRLRKIEENNEKNRKKQEQIQNNMENLQNKLEELRNNYLMKQHQNELKKQRLDAKREEEMRQKAESARIRAENTKHVLEKAKYIEQEKLANYNKKQQIIEMKKKELEIINQQKQEEKIIKNQEREQKIRMTIEKNAEIIQKKQQETLNKIHYKEQVTNEQIQKRNERNMEWAEENNEKMMIRQDNIRRLNRLEMLKRENTDKWINDKRKRIETIREQQQFLSQRKSQIKDEIARKKEQYMHQFACFFHKTSLDEKQMNKILKMLPDNPKIQALFERLRELEEDEINDRKMMENKNKQLEQELKASKNELRSFNSTQEKTITFKEHHHKISSSKEDNILIQDKVEAVEVSDSNPNITQSQKKKKEKTINNLKKNKKNEKNKNTQIKYPDTKQVVVEEKPTLNKEEPGRTNIKTKPKKPSNIKITQSKLKNNSNQNTNNQETLYKTSTIQRTIEEIEIDKKLKEYKIQLANDLLIFINEEKKKEEKRLEIYNNSPQHEKGELMHQLGEERAKSKMIILQKKE